MPSCAHLRAKRHELDDNLVGLVIAMKGGPCTGKTTLARALAKSLRSTLASLDSVQISSTSDTQRLLLMNLSGCPSPAPDHVVQLDEEVSHKVLWQVAETQLARQHSVVVDSPLHTRAHLDRLLALSNSEENDIMLIVIECRARDQTEWRKRLLNSTKSYSSEEIDRILLENPHDYDTGDIPKLTIDTTSPQLGDEDHLRNMESFILTCLDKKLYGEVPIEELASGCLRCKLAYLDKLAEDLPKTLKHPSHDHQLFLQDWAWPYVNGDARSFHCFGCAGVVENLHYSCVYNPASASSCNPNPCIFYLHAKCALNLPLTVRAEFHRWHPLILTTRPLDPELCYCDFCEERREPEEWIYFCEECEHYYHVKCTLPEFYASPDLVRYPVLESPEHY